MVGAELELPVGSLVIADLHLDLEEDGAVAPFLRWLVEHAGAPRLVILGDLFEFWIGAAQADSAGGREVIAALRNATDGGTRIDIVPGNRDFLLDEDFARRTGCRLRHEGLTAVLAGGLRVLFLHGDELCTLDTAYQRLRRVIRSGPVRFLANHMPLFVTRAMARRMRVASRRAVSGKDPAEMAQQPDACRSRAAGEEAELVVCGHAHRFRDEDLGGGLRWMVLDAFGGKRDTLEVVSGPEIAIRGSRQAIGG